MEKLRRKENGFSKLEFLLTWLVHTPGQFVNRATLFLVFTLMAGGCSGGDDEGSEPPTPPMDNTLLPYSVMIPDSNRNMPSGGSIVSEFSDFLESCDVGKLVDANPDTKFTTSRSRFYILWEGYRNVTVCKYSLTSAADDPTCDPKSWTFSGSSDAKNWTVLDKRTGVEFAGRKETLEYDVESDVAYKYFRLNFEGNNGGERTQIAEWTLEEFVVVIDPNLPYTIKYDNNSRNMPSSGTLTSQYSDFPETSHVGKLADGYPTSKFVTSHSEFYILWEGDEDAAVNNYSLMAVAGSDRRSDLKSWMLSGSNDTQNWTLVDEQTDQSFDAGEVKEFDLDNKTPYKYYKLDVRANNGGGETAIAEWTMEEIPDNIDDLMGKAGGFTHVEETPMGGKYKGGKAATEADKAWLKDPNNEPQSGDLGDGLSLQDKLYKFSVKLYPHGIPSPNDCNQGAVGNCGFIAMCASMAYQAPDFIKSIIKDNGNETFTVQMFDPMGNPIEVGVTSKFFSNNGSSLNSIHGQNGVATWSSVLEKAAQKWVTRFGFHNAILSGIGHEYVAPLFTGNGDSFAYASGVLTKSELARVVRVCLNKGLFVLGGFKTGGLPLDWHHTINNHVYSFMHSAQKSALFAVRNPHGGGHDGVLNVYNYNDEVLSVIDLRIIYPGKAEEYGSATTEPYIPPVQ